MENIILIGMPGCGKTTVGEILSDRLNMNFVDTDELLEKNYKKTIKNIFEYEGEEKFREYETETLKSLKRDSNTIISTGGGIIVKERNIPLLKELGKVIFIDRSVESILSTLDSGSRPLLTEDEDRIYKLYKDRYEKYKSSCDIIVDNDDSIDNLIESLIEYLDI